jgi:hypothetical protein
MILGWSSPRSHPLGVLGPSQALVLYICVPDSHAGMALAWR